MSKVQLFSSPERESACPLHMTYMLMSCHRSGFIAAHAVDILLKRGFIVRGTVRTIEKGEYMKRLLEDVGGDRFEYVVVEDLQKVSFDLIVRYPIPHHLHVPSIGRRF